MAPYKIRPTSVTIVELEATTGGRLPIRDGHSSSGLIHHDDSMTTADWRRVIVDAADSGIEIVQFVGGESALVHGLVEYALSAALRVDVHSPLVSVSEPMWELFAHPEVSLGVCWYAVDLFQHDEITGIDGSWYMARRNTAEALKAGLVDRVEVALAFGGQSLSAAYSALGRLGAGAASLDLARSLLLGVDLGQQRGRGGNRHVGVTSSGSVVPCVTLGRETSAGNVKDSSLAEILASRQWSDLLAESPTGRTRASCMSTDFLDGVLAVTA